MAGIYSDDVLRNIEKEFKHLDGSTYLDHAGSALYSQSQIERVMLELQSRFSLNPHTGEEDRIDKTRKKVLEILAADQEEYSVVFNSGATSGLKTIGEYFPWDINSSFVVHAESHTSSVGIREYALDKGSKILVWEDQDLEGILQNLDSGFKTETTRDVQNKQEEAKEGEEEEGTGEGVKREGEEEEGDEHENQKACNSKNLFCFPAMSNYNGFKFDLRWVEKIQENPRNLVLLDTSCFLSTNTIDLSKVKPDFLVLSFYKLFGYPTGLGALIIKKSSTALLKKVYFGGGTVDMHTVRENVHETRANIEERLEDGTIHFLGVQAVETGFLTIKNIIGEDFSLISAHTFALAQYTFNRLNRLVHWNGKPVVEIYSKTQYDDVNKQGGIINFNLKDSRGNYIGYSVFKRVAESENVIVRTGCFCNTASAVPVT
ncbi:molybdenum cofactor sulfurase [Eurytemora carolleeae]|uniref:molybdenum cofactor sulfurase n=1 Tax=Eurytemora carolleeae TaxID=1294199 RepID=UPI000C7859DC|nr:molybdenum cofactor sulfurase [Eurytemora carolleeae]|eukprot:XP_023320450.1 molybdenum cofactor sulfurase-like [Eurytemora affinis]